MTFKTKRDRFFTYLWFGMLLFINAVFIFPTIISPTDTNGVLLIILMDIVTTGFLLWIAIDIKYVLLPQFLYVKGGLFRSKIYYSDITRITRNPSIWIGYRILFSKDAIAVHYKTGAFGHIVISPENTEQFIEELLKRNYNIQVERITE